jgi:hypothetical protein
VMPSTSVGPPIRCPRSRCGSTTRGVRTPDLRPLFVAVAAATNLVVSFNQIAMARCSRGRLGDDSGTLNYELTKTGG